MARVRTRGKDGRAHTIEIYIGRGVDGKPQYWYGTYYGPKHKAKQYAQEMEAKLKRRVGPKGAAMTLGEYLQDVWLPGVKGTVTARTLETYAWHVRRLIPVVGELPLFDLTAGALQDALKGLDASALTKRQIINTLKTALRQAVAWRHITEDPTDGLRTPRVPRKRRDVLTKDELHRLLVAAEGYKHYPIIRLLALTGIRLGEALGLKWNDVDFERSRILIRRSIDTRARDFKPEGDEAKTANSERAVALDQETMAILAEMKRERMKGKVSPLKLGDTLVFGDGARPVRHEAVNRTLNRALKRAGLRHIRVHDLRHTVASILLDEGVPLPTVADMLGHRPDTTTRVYAHVLRRTVGAAQILHPDK